MALLAIGCLMALAGTASADTGAVAPPSDPAAPAAAAPTSSVPVPNSGIPFKAKVLPSGIALPPPNAPPQVVSAIAAGNQIRTFPYIYGGGHKSFLSAGYDCSGAVSYALNGAGLLAAPMPSTGFMTWGLPGRGAWITTFANRGHMYVVIAGLRFDTSALGESFRQGSGPRWRVTKRPPRGFVARHFLGL